MRKQFYFFAAFLLCLQFSVSAQQAKDPVTYMNQINILHRDISEDFLSYTSAVAHGKSARKVENRRKEIVASVKEAQKKIGAMPPYEGDKTLKDSSLSYLKVTYAILTSDYDKILNMEDIAEQSYDAMEAYLLAQDLADKKQEEAGDRLIKTSEKFAANHNIKMADDQKDELEQKSLIASIVSQDYRKVYLTFFKSYKQEFYLLDALNTKNLNGIEQNRNTLLAYSKEGMKKLDTMKVYKNDRSVITACRQLLDFYQTESESKITVMANYFIKEENFNKIKKAFDAKSQSSRTQADVDQYNTAVNEMNKASADYNTVNNQLNATRSKLITNYNNAASAFLDKHTPHYKK